MKPHSLTDHPSSDGIVEVINPSGAGDFLLVCEHASNFIPAELDNLGLSDEAIDSHIAWDPGALQVARELSLMLDAALVAQRISRLVYDCNRHPEAESAVPMKSEIYGIPGNTGLSTQAREARIARFYLPFRDRLAAFIDRRVAERRPPAIVTVHSFTPVYQGVRRDLDIGVLHDSDACFADALLDASAADADLVIRRNAPYGPEDGVTHTLLEHAIPRGLLNVMIEIRNDLIRDAAGQRAIAERLSRHIAEAHAACTDMTKPADRAGDVN